MTQLSGIPAPGNTQTAGDGWPPEIPPRKHMDQVPVCLSEADLASHLLYELNEDYRYATDLRCWLVRDGDRWVRSRQGVADAITEMVAVTSFDEEVASNPGIRKWVREGCRGGDYSFVKSGRDRLREYRYTADDVRVQDMLRTMQTPAGQGRLAALMRNMAGTDDGNGPYTVRADELDAEPGILWAGSVPFDLARSVTEPVWVTETYYDGGREEPWPMTYPHMLSCNYCPDIRVETPVWDQLMAAVFPDINEREHALNALAHGFHGWPTEAAVLARSATGTAKSLVATLISDLLGDYAGQVSAATLFGRSGNAQFAFDEMAGARFVVMNEGRKHDFASTEAFKAVVGPDPLVNARARHGQHRRLVPARHTLMLTVNPAADLDYSDPAVVRRLIPAGFAGSPRKIAEIAEKYGTKSAEGLAAWQAEAPGVLAQMIVRCAYVLGDPVHRGTKADTPESAQSRFDAVTAEADPWGRWFTERTCDGLPTANDDLLEDYQRWCKAKHEQAMSPTWFGRALASRGVERARTGHGRGWRVALRP